MKKETRHQRRHDSLPDSLSEGKMQFLAQRKDTLVKPNKLQTALFHPLKVSLISFSVLKLLNMKLENSKEKLK